jgi:hypothetical protein
LLSYCIESPNSLQSKIIWFMSNSDINHIQLTFRHGVLHLFYKILLFIIYTHCKFVSRCGFWITLKIC